MSLSDFESHLKDPTPGFRCFDCGDRAEKLAFSARIENQIRSPSSPRTLSKIDQYLGPVAESIKQFYANHDGLLMYEDTLLTRWTGGEYRAAGIAFFPIAEWERHSSEMREGLLAMGWSRDDMPDWLLEGIAFGEIPHSANYFVIQPTGENAGQIFYADHDDFDPNPIAASFEALLDSIIADPAEFLNCYGCYTRFSDGKTDIQWIPKEYVACMAS